MPPSSWPAGAQSPAGAPSRSGLSRTSRARSVPAPGVTDVEATFRREFGRAVATLVRLLGDIELAEEAVQEAFVVALEKWPVAGVPPNPGGWIVTTARNRAIDRVRRES